MVYQWKTPSLYKVPVDAAVKEILRVEQKNGVITPNGIVDAARPEEAVLHTCFDWNDTEAAEKWRCQQARVLIGNIVHVTVSEIESEISETVTVRAYVHVDGEDRNVYRRINVVINEDNGRERLINTALRELGAFREKYRSLKEFNSLFAEIDKLAGSVMPT